MRMQKNWGDGTVYQESVNKWTAKISLGTTPDGKALFKRFSARTKGEVEKKLKAFRRSLNETESVSSVRYTVRDYFHYWLKTYQFQKLKPSSYDRLESVVNNHILPVIGNVRFDLLTRDEVQRLINNAYRQKELSYSSVKKIHDALNACYKHALMIEEIHRNPCLGVVLPSSSERVKQVKSLSEEEVRILVQELEKKDENGKPLYHYAQGYMLILNTGLRMGEALSLQWTDVDFVKKTISVNKNHIITRKRDEEGNALSGYQTQTQNSTKTSSGRRIVPINQSAERALVALKEGNPSPYVIANTRGTAVMVDNFERSFRVIIRNAGLPHYGIHSLRHTFASLLFAAGVEVKVISKLLGHASVKITYDTYVHLFQEDYQEATKALDELF